MERVYAALRPVNLRTVIGPTTFDRGADVLFAFELENTLNVAVEIPVVSYGGRSTQLLGAIQTWLEPLTPGVDLSRCMPSAARAGARLAVAAHELPNVSQAPGQSFGPGEANTAFVRVPGGLTDCIPAGRYRFWVEYLAAGDPVRGVIAERSIDIVLREPTTWAATLFVAGAPGPATLELSTDGRHATSTIELPGLAAGATIDIAVRTGACDPAGAFVVPTATVRASDEGIARVRATVALSSAARRAIAAGAGASVWTGFGTQTACTRLTARQAATPKGRSPTTFGGPFLRATLPDGMAVAASSELVGGPVSQVMDGQLWTTWNSGGWPPAWVEIDLGRDTVLTGIRLMPSQLPNVATTAHRIYGRAAGSKTETLLYAFRGETRDEIWMNLAFSKKATVRYVRVLTVSSPSWVAWREIRLVGPTIPAFSAMPEGFHDGALAEIVDAGSGQCEADGWASDPDDRTADVSVRVLVDGTVVWTGVADRSIPSLGVGMPGYRVDLRSLLTLSVRHEIRVEARDVQTGRWADLLKTPRYLTCR